MAEVRPARWTVAELDRLPYDEWRRHEIIGGELYVSTAPHFEHQSACTTMLIELGPWNDQAQRGRVAVAPGLIFSDVDAVIPGAVWVSRAQLAALADDAGHLRGAPELVVEVLSAGAANERRDRELKLGLYSRYGVDEYWLVDWRAQMVDVYRRLGQADLAATRLQHVAHLTRDDRLTSPHLPGFALVVGRLFAA
jgi:Uma2 family endonuclease